MHGLLLPEGSVSYLYYADRLFQFPLGVFEWPWAATLPSLFLLTARKSGVSSRRPWPPSLGLTLFVNLPAAAGLAGLSLPLVDLLFGRGEFSSAAVHGTAMALLGYVVGLPAFSSVRSLASAYYALGDTRNPGARGPLLSLRLCRCRLHEHAVSGARGPGPGLVRVGLDQRGAAWALLRRHCGAWFRLNRDIVLSSP